MPEWGIYKGFFDALEEHSPMYGRFWLLLMLVFRMVILGTVASDLFDDEQEEFNCNTLQPGCKQVCYDEAFPISQYRFWVFHIVLISTPALVFLVYTMHKREKQLDRTQDSQSKLQWARRLQRLYIVNVTFRLLSELGFLFGQWLLYGFRVEAQYPCSRFPCPYTVDCFTSRPMEKTVFLVFYFAVGVLSAFSSLLEIVHSIRKLSASRERLVRGSSVEQREAKAQKRVQGIGTGSGCVGKPRPQAPNARNKRRPKETGSKSQRISRTV